MAALIDHVLKNLPEYLCKSWVFLIGIMAGTAGLICIGSALFDLLGGRVFGREGKNKW